MIKIIYAALFTTILACTSKLETQNNTMSKAAEYQEKYRLQFHFSPKEKWMNDPNGMIYHNGEYHLFYQHYPDSTVWGPMHWGHAISKDLIHWEQFPIALYPDSLGYIFSGSAVLDKENTSGLGSKENPALVAIFTYHDIVGERAGSDTFQTQGIAYSLDNGRTWEKYNNNPVLSNPGIKDFRDPNVFWSEGNNKWIMALAVKDRIGFYSSPDLKQWNHESDFGESLGAHGGVWECPDLFQLDNKWVLLVSINPGGPNGGSATQYFVGEFDGKTFTAQDDKTRWLDYGRDNYAGITWHNIPTGRKIFLGWMSNWDYANVVPTETWRSAMTVPRDLKLVKGSEGYLVYSSLVKEIEVMHQSTTAIDESATSSFSLNDKGWETFDLDITISSKQLETQSFKIVLSNDLGDELVVGYRADEKEFYLNRDKAGKNEFAENFKGIQTAPFVISGSSLKLSMLVDVGSIELFLNDGELVMTSLFFPQQPFTKAVLTAEGGQKVLLAGTISEMKSIWE